MGAAGGGSPLRNDRASISAITFCSSRPVVKRVSRDTARRVATRTTLPLHFRSHVPRDGAMPRKGDWHTGLPVRILCRMAAEWTFFVG